MPVAVQRARCSVLAVAVAATLCPTVSFADGDEMPLEEIEVTGSRIARRDFTSASPVVSVPGSLFTETSAVSVERTLAQLPQFVPTVTATSNAPSNDGQANLSLRGIGSAQTLVLLDGKRLMPADGRGSVDVNVLPPAHRQRMAPTRLPASSISGCVTSSKGWSSMASGA
jgi:iron complex outermembrane recepter protein